MGAVIALNALVRVALRILARAVVAVGIPAVFGGRARTDHFCRDVVAIWQQTLSNEPSISIDVQNCATQLLAGNQAVQG